MFKSWWAFPFERTLASAGYTTYTDGWAKWPQAQFIDYTGGKFNVAYFLGGELFMTAQFDSVEAAIMFAELEIANGH